MKKIMLLGGLSYLIPVIEAAHRQGLHVITVDYVPDNIAHKYSDEYYNISTMDKEAILELAEQIQIDGIMSFAIDAGVVSAAYVAEKMGLPFQCSYESTCILQDKALFRDYLAKNGFNTPKAKGYSCIDEAMKDMDSFSWPIMVKPVDSCGSKGVVKVEKKENLRRSIEHAVSKSHNGRFIIEDYLDVVGYQSSADVFAINGKLEFPIFSDQIFDKSAANPFTPAIEIWPSSMQEYAQQELSNELQRLFSLLGIRSGIFNVESRVCSNGKAYLMEVSPRGGGNRIAELQTMATGQDLIANEIRQVMGQPIDCITKPVFDGVWCNYILHSAKEGILKSIDIYADFKSIYVKDESYCVVKGDRITSFTGANTSLGTLFLRADSRKEMDAILNDFDNYVKIVLD